MAMQIDVHRPCGFTGALSLIKFGQWEQNTQKIHLPETIDFSTRPELFYRYAREPQHQDVLSHSVDLFPASRSKKEIKMK